MLMVSALDHGWPHVRFYSTPKYLKVPPPSTWYVSVSDRLSDGRTDWQEKELEMKMTLSQGPWQRQHLQRLIKGACNCNLWDIWSKLWGDKDKAQCNANEVRERDHSPIGNYGQHRQHRRWMKWVKCGSSLASSSWSFAFQCFVMTLLQMRATFEVLYVCGNVAGWVAWLECASWSKPRRGASAVTTADQLSQIQNEKG